MSRKFSAIFDAGVCRPLQSVDLAEGTLVNLQVTASPRSASDQIDDETRNAWDLNRMEAMPDNSPATG